MNPWLLWSYASWLCPKAACRAWHRRLPDLGLERPAEISVEQWEAAWKLAEGARWMDAPHLRWVRWVDPDYPKALRDLELPPLGIFVRGKGQLNAGRSLGMVGTRRPSQDGKVATWMLGTAVADAGVRVLSGLALGIDAEAHRAALGRVGGTAAVLASGVLHPSPASNRGLAREIMEEGVLLSEAPPDCDDVKPWHFPHRNRIVAALSSALLVVEAPEKSGALITARCALDLGREVWAAPGPLRSEAAKGSNGLLRDGAGFVGSVSDLLALLDCRRALEPPAQPLLAAMYRGAATPGELAQRTGESVVAVRRALVAYELAGAVQRTAGDRYRLVGRLGAPLGDGG